MFALRCHVKLIPSWPASATSNRANVWRINFMAGVDFELIRRLGGLRRGVFC